jgi:hypothetical protein
MTEEQHREPAYPNSATLRPLLKRRKPINHSSVPFVLCWSQKAGCTVALKWYLHHAGLLEDALQLEDPNMRLKIHSYENKVLKARPDYTDELVMAIQSGKPIVGFIRCPYERAFSSYMILNHGWYLKMKRRGVISPGMKMRQAVVEFVHGDGAEMGHPIAFRDYLLWLKQQDMSALDPHHTPQRLPLHKLVPATFYRLIDFEAAIDSMEKAFALDTSWSERERFSSGHHRPKVDTSATKIAAFLEEAVPLEAYPLQNLPKMTRPALSGTGVGALIEEIFDEDIAAYDSIAPITDAST